jgi:hypothetical protein
LVDASGNLPGGHWHRRLLSPCVRLLHQPSAFYGVGSQAAWVRTASTRPAPNAGYYELATGPENRSPY